MAAPLGLNDSFTEEGVWWLPSTPTNQIAGTLTFNQSSGPELSLIGLLGGFESFGIVDNERVTIYGVTKSGKTVSLINSYSKTRQFSAPGIMTEVYRSNILAIGMHFQTTDEEIFDRSWVRFEKIEEWLGHNPFRQKYDHVNNQISLDVVRPPAISMGTFGDYVIESEVQTYTDNKPSNTFSFRVNSELSTRSKTPKSLDWHFSSASRLQELASLCTGHYLPLISLRLQGPKQSSGSSGQRPVEISIYARMNRSDIESRATSEKPLVLANELIEFEASALELWYAQYETLSPVINLFFAVVGETSMFVNVRFLLAIQALEVFHRRTSGQTVMTQSDYVALKAELTASIPDKTSPAMREKLTSLYQFANEPSLMQRLKRIMADLETEFGFIPEGFSGRFLRSLVDTRNYNTHFSVELETKSLDAVGMYWASRRIILLLSVALLMRLGLRAQQISALLNRHREFSDLWESQDPPR